MHDNTFNILRNDMTYLEQARNLNRFIPAPEQFKTETVVQRLL